MLPSSLFDTDRYRFPPSAEGREVFLAEGVGFEPTRERKPPGGFQDRCLKPLGHPSKTLIAKAIRRNPNQNKRRFATHLLPFNARVGKCHLHDYGRVVLRTQKMPIDRKRDRWRAMADAPAHRQDIYARRDELRGVGIPQRVQGDMRQTDRLHRLGELLGEAVRLPRLAFPGSEDKTISGPLTESHGQALLLLSLPVRPELGHDGRRKRKRAPPPRRLRRLEAQATLAGLLERALDPQASPIKVDVLLTERT